MHNQQKILLAAMRQQNYLKNLKEEIEEVISIASEQKSLPFEVFKDALILKEQYKYLNFLLKMQNKDLQQKPKLT